MGWKLDDIGLFIFLDRIMVCGEKGESLILRRVI